MTTTATIERCSFACSGTYGHECGAPAVVVAVFNSKLTYSTKYFARRCAECAKIKGGENAGALKFETLDADTHINDWNGRY